MKRDLDFKRKHLLEERGKLFCLVVVVYGYRYYVVHMSCNHFNHRKVMYRRLDMCHATFWGVYTVTHVA